MPSSDLLIAFVLATSIFAYMPGPSTLYAAARTIAGGRRAGWFAALGIHVGGYVHVLAAAAGLAVVFQAIPTLYLAVKLAGAAYLIWLGVSMIRGGGNAVALPDGPAPQNPHRAFWQSAAVEILNPKTALFYVAFLPQFVDPAATLSVWLQLVVLGTVVNLMFSSADVICVLLADRVARYFRSSNAAGRWAQWFGGSVLVLLGLHLVLDRR